MDTSDLVAGLDRAAARLTDLADVDESAAQLVLTRADSTVPRLTGFLADSASVTVVDGGAALVYSARYAAAVHARNPWAAIALDASEEDVLDLYAEAAEQALDEIA